MKAIIFSNFVMFVLTIKNLNVKVFVLIDTKIEATGLR